MAKDVIEVEYCDNHDRNDEVPGTTRRLDLGFGPHEIELCDDCYIAHVRGLSELVRTRGRAVGEGSRKRLHCNFCTITRASWTTLMRHMEVDHPQGFAEMFPAEKTSARKNGHKKQTDETLVLDVLDDHHDGVKPGRHDLVPCPECAAAGNPTMKKGPQGLAIHRRTTHGVKGTSKATADRDKKLARES